MDRPDHQQLVREEFAGQVGAMSAGRSFAASEAIAPFVRLLPAPPSHVLDLACGPGIVTEAVAAHGHRVHAIDLTPEMLERARARCNAAGLEGVEFHLGSAEELPFEKASFDGAVSRLSLHHLPEPARALAELRRVVRPGGTIVLGDIAASPDPAEAALHDALEILRDPSHRRLLPAAELRELVEAAGFRIEHTETWENRKSFDEWAAIVAESRSLEPVKIVMTELARAGRRAGIDLREEDGVLRFTHHWVFLQATAA